MFKDSRRKERRPVRYSAWLALSPNKRLACLLSDVSETGACIAVEDSDVIPIIFYLLLSENGSVHRACRVVWRKPTQIGVKFERVFTEAERATLMSTLDGKASAAAADAEPAESAQPASS
jgi:PilZ domain